LSGQDKHFLYTKTNELDLGVVLPVSAPLDAYMSAATLENGVLGNTINLRHRIEGRGLLKRF